MPRGIKATHQKDPDVARLKREVEESHRREVVEIEARIAAVEARATAVEARATAIEAYIVDDLVPWLEGHRTFTGYGTAVPVFTP